MEPKDKYVLNIDSTEMFEKENQIRISAKSAKQTLHLSILSIIILIISLVLFYPLSMEVDKYSNIVLIIGAYSFYIFQGASFLLTIITFIRAISLIKANKNYRNYLSLIICSLSFAVFGYEAYWFIAHI